MLLSRNGLLPGDQLIKIDGRNVDAMSREELQNAVRSAGNQIVLEVKSVPELAEFCDRKHRQSGARDDGDQLMLGHINTNLHEDIPEDQRYWLIHKGGYTMVRLLEHLPDGRALVKVAGREMTVDSTDVDRMNPTQLDRVGDIAALRYLNETSAVHLLRQRHGCNLLYTNAGLMSIVCMASAEEGAVGQDRLVTLFKGCRRGQMPAHVYATAQQVYRPGYPSFYSINELGRISQRIDWKIYGATKSPDDWAKSVYSADGKQRKWQDNPATESCSLPMRGSRMDEDSLL
ncbi:hypothetical protein NECAME_06689 [Necator americanus]|uniref:PDZ domain-containing protein n=1 Tax=Necator americanus TaxID=51031 RepID=W2TRY4_NECAM|nr:hypothetical protein NECAME_06689 [Necator americanus]ETN84805.1 hypothetical protein NECAME_06689 [Necator americanus]